MGTLILVSVYVLVVTILIPFVLSMCCLATWTLVKALITRCSARSTRRQLMKEEEHECVGHVNLALEIISSPRAATT